MEILPPLKPFLDSEGRLTAMPAKRKRKDLALCYLAGKFVANRIYTEREVNGVIGRWTCFHDPATVRRELFDRRFLGREPAGRAYWLEPFQPAFSDSGELILPERREAPSP